MAKNSGKIWTKGDESKLKSLLKGNTPTPLVAWKLGRTTHAIYQKARELKVSTKPVNKSPYNRQKAKTS